MPAFQKGHKKVGGRKPGSHNKSTLIQIEAARAAADMSIMPVDYMLMVMRDPTAPAERRDRMAAAVAPYVHPKLSAVLAKVENEVTVLSDEEKRAESERARLDAQISIIHAFWEEARGPVTAAEAAKMEEYNRKRCEDIGQSYEEMAKQHKQPEIIPDEPPPTPPSDIGNEEHVEREYARRETRIQPGVIALEDREARLRGGQPQHPAPNHHVTDFPTRYRPPRHNGSAWGA